MIRGTTPTLVCTIKTLKLKDISIAQIYIILKQPTMEYVFKYTNNEVVVDRNKNTLSITLSQIQTLSFTAGVPLNMQIRLLDSQGTAFATKKKSLSVDDILKDGVISV